jgi:hypothetical protein
VKRFAILALVVASTALAVACCLRPLVKQDYEFPAGYLAGLQRFDPADWATVLRLHVDGEGRVDYEGLLAAREPLQRYLALIGEVGPTTRPGLFPDDDARLAYWINAYNAATLHQVLRRWPIESVIDHKLSFFVLTRYRVDGRSLSLYSIENDIVRGQFGDPRIHFALNCASVGCPRLPAEPFVADRLQEQLERETKRFLGESRNVAMEGDALVLSEIFDWYGEDFEPDAAAWVRLRRPELAIPEGATVKYRAYDWGLNRQGAAPTK